MITVAHLEKLIHMFYATNNISTSKTSCSCKAIERLSTLLEHVPICPEGFWKPGLAYFP